MDERAFSRPCDPGHDAQYAERNVDAYVAEVMPGRVPDRERARRRAEVRLERGPAVGVATGQRPARAQPVDGALEAHRSAGTSRTRPEIDHVVGDLDRLR